MMTTNRLFSWMAGTALVLATVGPTQALAQELKIGYVNSERVLKEANPAKAAQKKLEAEFGKRESELSELATRLKAMAEKYDRDKLTMTPSDRERQERVIVDQDRDIQRQRRDYQEDLNQRKSEELSALVERTNRVIKQIFDQEKYDLILQDAVFVSPRIDITDKVIKALNAAPVAAGK